MKILKYLNSSLYDWIHAEKSKRICMLIHLKGLKHVKLLIDIIACISKHLFYYLTDPKLHLLFFKFILNFKHILSLIKI